MAQRRLVIAAVAALAAAAALWAWRRRGTEDPRDVNIPRDYHFRCLKCDRRWTTTRQDVTRAFDGGMPTTLGPANCPTCRQKTAYLMARCPWCGKHYVHRHLLTGQSARPTTDICPHCHKDTLTWGQK